MYSLVDRYQCFRWTCCLHLYRCMDVSFDSVVI